MIADVALRLPRIATRLLVVRGPSPVDRMFVLTGVSDLVRIVDLDPGEPAVQALLHAATTDQDGRPDPLTQRVRLSWGARRAKSQQEQALVALSGVHARGASS